MISLEGGGGGSKTLMHFSQVFFEALKQATSISLGKLTE